MKILSIILKFLSFGILIFIWAYTFNYFAKLPNNIPIHFDFKGKPNGFGSKTTIWLLPIIAAILFIFMFYLSKNTSSIFLSLPENIKENAKFCGLIVDGFNLITISILSVISYESIAIALGKLKNLSYTVDCLLVLIFAAVIGISFYSYFLSKKNNYANFSN